MNKSMFSNNIFKLCLFLIALLLFSCNRFDNSFQPADPNGNDISQAFDEHLEGFTEILRTALLGNDLTPVMVYYSDDYLNDGSLKSDVENYYHGLTELVTEELQIFHVLPDSGGISLTFSLIIRDTTAGIDTTFTEYCLDEEHNFLFIGNRQNGTETFDRKVLVELFTATWCPNCPYVEAALNDLKQLYGEAFYYIEYHISDQLAFGHNDILEYYELPLSLPIGIVQGQLKISGGHPTESYPAYNFAISQYFALEADYLLTGFDYTINQEVLSFALTAETMITDQPDLQLRYALIDKETDVNNAAGEPCRNVVIAKGSVSLSADDLNSILNAELSIPDFSFNDSRLVVWIQTVEDNYDEDTCFVHNVYEYEIEIPGSRH
jgi:thiol-disulfide isomerase/thioredoxin